jgi:hypothetical protein
MNTLTRRELLQRQGRELDLKLRLALGIPYHEWQEALEIGEVGIQALFAAYAPRWPATGRHIQDGPCCPPWASRRYREAAVLELYFGLGRWANRPREGGLSGAIERMRQSRLSVSIDRVREGGLSGRIAEWANNGLRGHWMDNGLRGRWMDRRGHDA